MTAPVPLARRSVRSVLSALGIVVFGVGLLVALDPDTARLIPVEAAVLALGSDYVVVAALGLLAVGFSGLVVASRRVRGVDEVTPPAVEGVQSAARPGRAFDRSVGTGWLLRWVDAPDPHPRLEAAAIRATMRADGCSRADAERRVADGSWTDDAVAARYLRDSSHSDASTSLGRHDRRRVRRTVDAIARRSDGSRGDR